MSFITITKKEILNGKSTPVAIPEAVSFLALYNCNVYWIIPKTVTSTAEIPEHTQFLLWKNKDNSYGVMLPMIDGSLKGALRGCEKGILLTAEGALSGQEPDSATLLYTATGDNPYILVEQAVKTVRQKLNSFKLRTEKERPDFLDSLGWCTWDAFYGSVDEEKVLMGLDSFAEKNIPLGYMILDDGSWDAYYDYLNEIRVKPEKFPMGLKNLIALAKEKYGLKRFGMWHCFEGYWGGLMNNGELAKRYSFIPNEANIRPWEEVEKVQPLYLVDPNEIGKFYEEFHSYMANQGVDMVKIDGQSAMDLFTKGILGMADTMQTYQKAMQASAKKYFNGNVIHCMSNSVDVAYNMEKTNCWRNSYDYAPSNMKMQKEHLYINAMNAMWSSTFSVPDWDMFQTHSAGAELHAAARAISGGPVYICDYPGKQNTAILHRLITSNGTILCCDNPALPTEDCLFTDFTLAKKPLKLFNKNGNIGVLGFFHCCLEPVSVEGSFCPTDVFGLEGDFFAAYFFNKGIVTTLTRNEFYNISLAEGEFELVTLSSIQNGVAVFGLTEKYNSSAAVIKVISSKSETSVTLSDGGRITLYSEHRPTQILCNGSRITFTYNPENGLLQITANTKGTTQITIKFS